ncbi:MAG TPA: pyridoxamine 5'-phosphate oxidase family protein [Propionibacteriaceae bacterium]|nr:pyridoxamine 5'-phosphate oxidase family protein [Propionibacteriaceae bacterium]
MARTLKPSRHSNRAATDRDALNDLLDEVLIGYIGISLDEGPLVLPVSFARDGDRILFHGSVGSHRMRALAAGAHACFTVTSVDGLTVGRTSFGTGMQYRSGVLFGACTQIEGADKAAALELYTDRYLPGRSAEVRASTKKELLATMVLALPITEWSMKVDVDLPGPDSENPDSDAWAGVIPLFQGVGDPVPNPELRAETPLPESVRGFMQ